MLTALLSFFVFFCSIIEFFFAENDAKFNFKYLNFKIFLGRCPFEFFQYVSDSPCIKIMYGCITSLNVCHKSTSLNIFLVTPLVKFIVADLSTEWLYSSWNVIQSCLLDDLATAKILIGWVNSTWIFYQVTLLWLTIKWWWLKHINFCMVQDSGRIIIAILKNL